MLCRLRGKQPRADPSWVPGLWLGRGASADVHVVGTTSRVFKTRSIRSHSLILPPVPEIQGLPQMPVQERDGTSTVAVDLSQHGLQRTSDELGDEAQQDEPPNLFQRVGPAQSDLKRSAPDSVPGSETKLQRISAVFEDASCLCCFNLHQEWT